MKNIVFCFILAVISIHISCVKEGLLNKDESGDMNEDIVFSNAQLTKQFLTNIYILLPYGWDQQYWIDGVTDDGEHRPFNTWAKDVYNGAYSPINIPNQFQRWARYYEAIRACNRFIEKVDGSPVDLEGYTRTEEIRTRMKYEAVCLRAYYYAELLRWYGGAPIITSVLDLDSPELYSSRANLQEMKDFIIEQCDLAAANLPAWHEPQDFHRVTSAVAHAIKARVLLQLASPLFNNSTDALGNPTQLSPWSWGNYDAGRWKEAADAAREFMSLRKPDGSAYELHTKNTRPNNNYGNSKFTCLATQNSLGYYWVFIDRVNPEIILSYSKKGNATNEVTKWCVPHTMQKEQTQAGATLPTMNLVGAFQTRNGIQVYKTNDDGSYLTDENGQFVINELAVADGFDPRNPYANRDNRFYHCIYYNTCKANGVEFEIWRSPGDGTFGLEYNPAFAHTGFFIRKFNDPWKVYPNADRKATIVGTTTNSFPLYRYVEILLNYAEAENEYLADGADRSSIIEVLDQIRSRADMPDVVTTFQRNGWSVNSLKDMRAFIRNERRIELAFEIHRIHDVRRWKIGETTQCLIYGQDIVKNKETNEYTYQIELWRRRIFTARHYLMPIPHSEVSNNPEMVQNPGW